MKLPNNCLFCLHYNRKTKWCQLVQNHITFPKNECGLFSLNKSKKEVKRKCQQKS